MNKIRNIRKKNNLTIKQLSEQSGVPYRTIQGWERGERLPRDVYQIHKVAKTLNVLIEELIDFEEEN
nr:helix-turn-helix transcriptional regulator [uncultured Aminipila sp.]